MPASIDALLRRADLGIALSSGASPSAVHAPIRWVTTSELTDPTPYLRGGELLLTTGMRLPAGTDDVLAYVRRLAHVGVVGIGFGVGAGLAHRAVPPRLLRAADTVGMPLLIVDEPTPFIAIGEAVAHMHLADETVALAQALKAQQAITRAAVSAGQAGVVRQLAASIDGWALVASPDGDVLCDAPSGSGDEHSLWRAELGRLRGGRATSAAIAAPGSYVTVHALGDGRELYGFLVTGLASRPTTAHHSMTNVAAALLAVAAGLGRGWGEASSGGRYGGYAGARSGVNGSDRPGAHDDPAALLDRLARFRPHSRISLTDSLRAWLAHHGRIEPAARELGLHRNTLHHRIEVAGLLLDRNLDDPATRAALWVALNTAR